MPTAPARASARSRRSGWRSGANRSDRPGTAESSPSADSQEAAKGVTLTRGRNAPDGAYPAPWTRPIPYLRRSDGTVRVLEPPDGSFAPITGQPVLDPTPMEVA